MNHEIDLRQELIRFLGLVARINPQKDENHYLCISFSWY
jgi:hypothetical protein